MSLKNNKMIKITFLTGIISVAILGGYSKLNKDVTLIVNGEEKQISTFKYDVQDLLVSEGIKYDKNDIVTKDLDEKLNDGMEIEIINVTEEIIKESKSVPFEVSVLEDEDLLKGQTKIEEEGKAGENQLVYKVTYHNGKPVKKTFVEEVVFEKPINKVVKKGTKVEEVKVASSRGESSRNIYSNTNSKGRHMSVVATAYTGDSLTSTGKKPRWGTISVDPKVIPYGTKVYIPQFDKIFIAEDCGGAIKGNKIDIFMNDESSVYNWGRKTIDIYIVD